MSDILKKLIEEYTANLDKYNKMGSYYDGQHDILKNYHYEENRANQKIIVNYVHKFIEEELSYIFGNPLTYISKSGNETTVNDIDYQLSHWKATHNQELTRILEIFGTAYELYYINKQGEFCSRILNPTNGIVLTDTDDVPQMFIHFYKNKYEDSNYYDVYYSDRIEIYKDDVLIDTKKHLFNCVPVSVCTIGDEQTIYSKIKSLNDSLNSIMSDQLNTISDFRSAYLIVTGSELDEETALAMKTKGLINLKSKEGKVEWLMKEINTSYIETMLTNIKDSIYSVCNHIDGNEKLQSNTSGVALRTRLVFLEQRCKTIFDAVSDTISDRIKFLFHYLSIKNKAYDYKDITVSYSPCIPQDIQLIAQTINQLGDKISLETALAQLPFISNPASEIAKIKKEQSELQEINLDKAGLTDE